MDDRTGKTPTPRIWLDFTSGCNVKLQTLPLIVWAALACWFCVGCSGTAVITDSSPDRVIIAADHAAASTVAAEAEHRCAFYGRSAVLASRACLDLHCQKQRVEFRCQRRREVAAGRTSPWLGLSVDDITDHLFAEPPGSSEVVVSRVFVDGPAGQAGLRVGDIIESFNGASVSDAASLAVSKNALNPGEPVAMGIRRGRDRFNVLIQAQ
jgi:hypothetical protein